MKPDFLSSVRQQFAGSYWHINIIIRENVILELPLAPTVLPRLTSLRRLNPGLIAFDIALKSPSPCCLCCMLLYMVSVVNGLMLCISSTNYYSSCLHGPLKNAISVMFLPALTQRSFSDVERSIFY